MNAESAAAEPRSHPPPTTSGAAVASLIFSILSLLCILPFIGSLIGIVCGFIAKSNIRSSGGRLTGGGMATTGLVLGFLALLIHIVLTAGTIYAGYVFARSAIEMAKQMEGLEKAAAKGDWEAVLKEFTGPGSMSQEEMKSRLEDAQKSYGKIQGMDLAQSEWDKSETNFFKIPLKLVFNVAGEKEKAHMTVKVRREQGRFIIRSLDFGQGEVPTTIHRERHGGSDSDN
jgi:hypothetical protein